MAKNPWTSAFGKASVNVENPDVLLNDKVNERRRKQIDRQEQLDDAKHDAEMAKLTKEKATSEAAVEKTTEKKEETSGFKVTGGLDIGTFNLQEERKAAQAEAERLRQEAANSANRTAQENLLLRDQIHAAEMREIKATNEANLALIKDRIDDRSPVEIIADIRAMAAELGLKAPDPGISDPSIQLQILGMQQQEAQRQREFEWDKMKHTEDMEERREQRRANAAFKQAELAQQQQRDDFWNQAPKVIGEMAGKAYYEAGRREAEAPIASKSRRPTPGYEAAVGEGGEADCLSCGQPVAIGPTAKSVECASCGARHSIKRVPLETEANQRIPGQEPLGTSEDLEG